MCGCVMLTSAITTIMPSRSPAMLASWRAETTSCGEELEGRRETPDVVFVVVDFFAWAEAKPDI